MTGITVPSHSKKSFSFLVNKPPNTPRADHIAYTIENWDKNTVEAELKGRGLKPEPQEGSAGFFAPWLSEATKSVNGTCAFMSPSNGTRVQARSATCSEVPSGKSL